MKKLQFIPPSPEIMSVLYMEYLREGKPSGMTFFQYLDAKGYSNPAHNLAGMDTGASFELVDGALDLIRIPKKPIHGQLHVKVLLIDFVDQPGQLPRQYYEDLLFSTGIHPRGSMRDYYHEVSLGKVDISGSVHGWLRMPEPYMFYTNNESGIFGETESTTSYPRNAQRMAEDAVRAAQKYQLPFESGLDKLDQGTITALFIVHAGRGAERLHPLIRRNEIWSHKWELKHPIEVAPGLFAVTYLTVPQECDLGVCAHELGHLAFQWQDFYDSNQAADGIEWSGSGFWDLMASGSYNGSSWSPAHPAGLHKSQHNWIDVDTITYVEGIESETRLEIKPYTATDGKVVKIISPHYNAGQYLLLENRTRLVSTLTCQEKDCWYGALMKVVKCWSLANQECC